MLRRVRINESGNTTTCRRIAMKKFAMVMGALVLSGGLLLMSGVKANAAGSGKSEITANEHKMIACTSADELMKYYDDSADVNVYDFVPPLQYTGTKSVHDD